MCSDGLKDYEIALDQALDRIRGDSNESDEESFSPTDLSLSNQPTNVYAKRLLCMPHRTRQGTSKPPSSQFNLSQSKEPKIQNRQNEMLTQSEFCERLLKQLHQVQTERVKMTEHARMLAKRNGKSYREVMAIRWDDTPESIKYISLSDNSTKLQASHSIDSGLGHSNKISFTSDPYYYRCQSDAGSFSNISNSDSYIPYKSNPPPLHLPPPSTSCKQQPSFSSSSLISTNSRASGHNIIVAYTIAETKQTFKTTIPVRQSFTLWDFKQNVFFNKRGNYRFFFKTYCVELNDIVYEEISFDYQTLPMYEGKLVVYVEEINK